MTTAGYRLFRKSVTSRWPSVPRHIKVIAVLAVVLLLILAMINQSRNMRYTRMMYDMQGQLESIIDIFLDDVEENESKDRWRELNIKDSMIFSAFVDDRIEVIANHRGSTDELTWAEVRIIAIMPSDYSGGDFQCVYKYDTDNENVPKIMRKMAVSVQAIRENWKMKYSAFFVLCELTVPKNWEDVIGELNTNLLPTSITVSRIDEKVEEDSFVKIHYPVRGFSPAENDDEFLAVCIPVFHHNYDRPLHLIEFIEYYRMMGAGHFTFYNSSISSRVDRVLRYYEDRGNITVLPWNLSPYYVFEVTLRVDGIFAALNDCLYRSSFYNNYAYVANVDVDEFIVPRKHDNFSDMINYLESTNTKQNNHGAFIIRNAFFYDFYADDVEGKEAGIPYLSTQAKTRRVLYPNEVNHRSKYIVRSKNVVELGNHFIWEFRGQTPEISYFGPKNVDPSDALLHHYRACEGNLKDCQSKRTIIDKTAHRFIHELGRRVSESCNAVFDETDCSMLKT